MVMARNEASGAGVVAWRLKCPASRRWPLRRVWVGLAGVFPVDDGVAVDVGRKTRAAGDEGHGGPLVVVAVDTAGIHTPEMAPVPAFLGASAPGADASARHGEVDLGFIPIRLRLFRPNLAGRLSPC